MKKMWTLLSPACISLHLFFCLNLFSYERFCNTCLLQTFFSIFVGHFIFHFCSLTDKMKCLTQQDTFAIGEEYLYSVSHLWGWYNGFNSVNANHAYWILLVSLYDERTAWERRKKKKQVTKNCKILDFFWTFSVENGNNKNVQILFSLANTCKQLHVLLLHQFKTQRANPFVIFMALSGRKPALLASVPSPQQTVSGLQLHVC